MKYHMIPIYVVLVQLLLSPYLFSSFRLFFNQVSGIFETFGN